jgi:hypothetical protein
MDDDRRELYFPEVGILLVQFCTCPTLLDSAKTLIDTEYKDPVVVFSADC